MTNTFKLGHDDELRRTKKTRVFLDKILRRFSMREQAEKKKFT